MKRICAILLILCSSAFALTPHERQLVTKARDELRLHDQERDKAIAESEAAKQTAAQSAESANLAEQRAQTAEAQATAEHAQLVIAVGYKVKADKLDSLNKHWGLNAVLYGFGVLARHILILIAVLIVLAILIGVGSLLLKTAFPWLAPIASLLEGLWAKLLSVFTPKPKI